MAIDLEFAGSSNDFEPAQAMGQGGSTPGAYATTPTDDAYVYVSPTPALAQGGGNLGALLAGSKWTGVDSASNKTIITFSFADPATSTFAYTTNTDFLPTLTAFSEADRQLTRDMLARVEAVCNVDFVEVADNASECGVLRYGYSQEPNDLNHAGYAFFPSSSAIGGDIWIGAAQAGAQWAFYRPNLLLHETLHALGLKHPFADGNVLPTSQDIIPNTVMSYSTLAGSTSGSMSQYPGSPMVLDVATLQYLYGANNATNAGNTVYDVAGADFQSGFRCLWDGGGIDTLDASRATRAVSLDLTDGALSNVGASVTARGVVNSIVTTTTYTDTVSLAQGVTIENATGSALADMLRGNAGANTLSGGAGDDRLEGRGGDDVIDGGAGRDTAVFDAARSAFTITQADAAHRVTGPTGMDTLSNVERLSFSDARVALDLDGNAGLVAKLLGAAFGAGAVDNAQYVGIGLNLLDGGTSPQAAAQLALDTALHGHGSNRDVIELLAGNIYGGASDAQKAGYVELLDNGTYTQASLALLAADSTVNLGNIDFVGLAAHGIAYA